MKCLLFTQTMFSDRGVSNFRIPFVCKFTIANQKPHTMSSHKRWPIEKALRAADALCVLDTNAQLYYVTG